MSENTYAPTPSPPPAGGDVDLSNLSPTVTAGTTAASMFAGLFWMLATGRMYTRSQHREILTPREEENKRLWSAVDKLTSALQKLTVNSDLTVQTFRSIDKTASEKDES
jgi:hypothetical protein